MKKVLLAFDGINYSKSSFEFARRLNETEPVLLTGVFLPQVNYANVFTLASPEAPPFIPMLESEGAKTVESNIKRFEQSCIANNINFRIHKHFDDFAIPELRKETRFADLLILGSESFYKSVGTEQPNAYLQEILYESECPVLVVPDLFRFPSSNILSFDATESSVFAIRQFAYLFPQLCRNKTALVYANQDPEPIPDAVYVEELAARHFSHLTIMKLNVDPKKYFNTWIEEQQGAIVVCGAFGRSSASRLFHKSFITAILAEHKLPVFIAHR